MSQPSAATSGSGTFTRRYTALLLCTGAASAALVLLAVLQGEGTGEQGWLLAARYTARVSALWFLVVFAVSPLSRRLHTALMHGLLRERRGLGLAFCAAHSVHLGAIAGVLRFGGERDPLTLAGGGLAYLLMFVMAATSNDAAVRTLGGARWRLLHAIGLYYLWLIFFQTYAGSVIGEAPTASHWLIFGSLCVLMLWRVAEAVLRRRAQG